MNEKIAVLCVIAGGGLTAVSQILLKYSAIRPSSHWVYNYLNVYVISSYSILLFTVFLNAYFMRFLPFRLIPVLTSSAYVFVVLLSKLFFHEALTNKRIIGTITIICGMIIFNF